MSNKPAIEKLLEHKAALTIGIVAVVAFAAISIVLYANNHSISEIDDSSSSEQTPQTIAYDKLSDEQKSKIGNYTTDEQLVQSTLECNVWGSEDGKYVLSFSSNTFTVNETSEGSSDTIGYVIDALKQEDFSSDDNEQTTFLLSAETPEKSFFMELQKTRYDDGNIQYLLTSDYFDSEILLSPVSLSDSIEVKELNQDFLNLIDNDKEGLETCIKEYCAGYSPTTATVTWNKIVNIDWTDNTVTASFAIDDTNTSFSVVYNRDDKTFEVEKSSLA